MPKKGSRGRRRALVRKGRRGANKRTRQRAGFTKQASRRIGRGMRKYKRGL